MVEAFLRVVKSVRAAQSGNGKADRVKRTEEKEAKELDRKQMKKNGAKALKAVTDADTEDFEWVEAEGNGKNGDDSPVKADAPS